MAARAVNYIPRPDAEFNGWAAHFYGAVKHWWGDQGLDPAELEALEAALQVWQDAYPAHVAAAAAAHAAQQSKLAARAALEAQVRPVTRFVQGYPKTTDAERAGMGISLRRGQRGAGAGPPSPGLAFGVPGGAAGPAGVLPATRPLVRIDTSQRLRHTLRFSDESTPTRRARPRGVLGAEVWLKLVAPPQPAPRDPALLSFFALATRPTCTTTFTAADGGKTAVYMLRWITTRGEKGPWSEAAMATVGA